MQQSKFWAIMVGIMTARYSEECTWAAHCWQRGRSILPSRPNRAVSGWWQRQKACRPAASQPTPDTNSTTKFKSVEFADK
eukprot:scaffold282912_cov20-Prasinocladus_malaysianus.AAC.1